MKRLLVGLLFLLLPASVFGLEVRSIYPGAAVIGAPVTIVGGPFSKQVRVSLGNREVRPVSVTERELVFIVPQLALGEHALFLREGEVSSATYSLLVELPSPEIHSLSPAQIDVCSSEQDRQILLRAENAQDGVRLLLNEKAISFSREDSDNLSFSVPALRAGSYGLQLVNPDGKKSLPQTLWVSNVPEIEAVSVGDDFVNFYQMIISGKNFFHNSVLLVTDFAADFSALPPRQRFIPAQGGSAYSGEGVQGLQRESVRFQDCNTLIYDRYPVSGQSRRILLRVGNPDGKQTAPYEIFLP